VPFDELLARELGARLTGSSTSYKLVDLATV
jgi:hypothetical protein